MKKIKDITNNDAILLMSLAEKTPGDVDNKPTIYKVNPDDFHSSESVPYLLNNLSYYKCIYMDHDTLGDKLLLVVGNGRSEVLSDVCQSLLTSLYRSFDENINLVIEKEYVLKLTSLLISELIADSDIHKTDDGETESKSTQHNTGASDGGALKVDEDKSGGSVRNGYVSSLSYLVSGLERDIAELVPSNYVTNASKLNSALYRNLNTIIRKRDEGFWVNQFKVTPVPSVYEPSSFKIDMRVTEEELNSIRAVITGHIAIIEERDFPKTLHYALTKRLNAIKFFRITGTSDKRLVVPNLSYVARTK